MKPLVITAMACATAIVCVLLLRVERPPAQPQYQLYSLDEIYPQSGETGKSVYRIDTFSGRTWRITWKAFSTGTKDEQNKPMLSWADAWEEIPESPDEAVAKEQAPWLRALAEARAQRATPTPHESPRTGDIFDQLSREHKSAKPTPNK